MDELYHLFYLVFGPCDGEANWGYHRGRSGGNGEVALVVHLRNGLKFHGRRVGGRGACGQKG